MHLITKALLEFDCMVQSAFEGLFGITASDSLWAEVSLSPAHGGLSLHQAALHAPAAYLSSLDLSFNLATRAYPSFAPVDLQETCSLYGTLVTESSIIHATSIPHPPQHPL